MANDRKFYKLFHFLDFGNPPLKNLDFGNPLKNRLFYQYYKILPGTLELVENQNKELLKYFIASSFVFRSLDGHGHAVKHRTPSTVSAPHLTNGSVVVPDNISEEDEDNESEDTASLGKYKI